jgi:hypothetical protein
MSISRHDVAGGHPEPCDPTAWGPRHILAPTAPNVEHHGQGAREGLFFGLTEFTPGSIVPEAHPPVVPI